MKNNYIAGCKRKTSKGYSERTYSVSLPKTDKGLRKAFGPDINTKENVVKVYKNGVCYTNDKKLGYSVRYIPIEDKSCVRKRCR